MGPSGSGKSTLMHCCAALDVPTSGQVFVGDTEIGNLSDKKLTHLRRERIGFVFQSFNLVPDADSGREHPAAAVDRRPQARAASGTTSVIATVNLGDRLDHRPNQLSGGQQQRVAVARALMSRPAHRLRRRAHRQPRLQVRCRGADACSARAWTTSGQTIVMVTHDPVAAAYTDRVVFLADGQIVDELRRPDREQVLNKMQELAAREPAPPGEGDLTCGA